MSNSNKIINSVLNLVKEKDLIYHQRNKLDFTQKSLKKWKRTASYAISMLDNSSIDYTLIKAYDIPFALMEDVDILVENHEQLLQLYNNLMKSGFVFKHVPFNDKLKLSAINNELDIEIDFYPDSKWGELRYARHGLLSGSKRKNTKHGIKAYTPKAEHEIYTVASHSYNHGRISLLEILNTVKIILDEDPLIDEIISLAKSFHMQNGTLVLLSATNQLLKIYGFGIPDSYLEKLRVFSHKRFQNLSKNKFDIDSFPIQFSVGDLLSASLSKITASDLDKLSPRFDELNGFMKHNRFANSIYSRFSRRIYKFIPN